ncbi:MAG: hypothetical protein WC965_02265 [Thiohalomonadaceae bacterium]
MKDFVKFPDQIIEDSIFSTTLARQNWQSKYQYDNETPLETFKRVAKALASVEKDSDLWYGKFLDMMVKTEEIEPGKYRAVGLKNTFGGRITANAGTEYNGTTLMNCFIMLPPRNATVSYTHRFEDGSSYDVSYDTQGTPDNLKNIMLTLLEQAETLKSEGGYGINFGFIRPRGSVVNSLGIKHPGVVSYMDIWDKVAEVIVKGDSDGYQDILENFLGTSSQDVAQKMKKQARKGAQMAVLPVWHPDIEEFVKAKQEPGRLTKFNLSVLMDDSFLEAVENDEMYELWFPVATPYTFDFQSNTGFVDVVDGKMASGTAYSIDNLSEAHASKADYFVDPYNSVWVKRIYKLVKARDLYDLIMTSTYNRAEPGVLFYDSMQKNNPISYISEVTGTNPCGEVPGFLTVCLLGNINLTQYVKLDRTFDWEEYVSDVHTFARALDNVNDITKNSLPQYDWATENIRQYGLGINGLGSALIMMGMPFGSEEAKAFTERVTWLKEDITWKASALLAEEKGAFPGFSEKFFDTYWFREFTNISDETKALLRKHGARNGKTTTNAPNGNTSIICDVTSNGIEPVFMLEYNRTYIADKWPEGMTKDNITELLEESSAGGAVVYEGEYAGQHYYYEPHNRGLCIVEKVRDYGYSWVLANYPEDVSGNYLSTTETLSVQDHVDSQAIVQRNTNQSVSKTANLPAGYDFEDFKQLYLDAWKKGLNGLTTYVAGSMESVLSKVEDTKEEVSLDNVLKDGVVLPETFVNGDTTVIKREDSKFYIHFSYHPEDVSHTMPVAMWISSNNTTPLRQVNGAVKEVITLLEKAGINPDLIQTTLEKIKNDKDNDRLARAISMALRHNVPIPYIVDALNRVDDVYVSDLLFAARKFLSSHVEDGTAVLGETCSECGSDQIIFESGCTKCLSCGASNCS